MDAILKALQDGYRTFFAEYNSTARKTYRDAAARGQSPKVMCITCSDSRVNPTILTGSDLGQIFTVSNVANLVPPYEAEKDGYHGVSAALEFAVLHLQVEHIIVLGHSSCGGIRALMKGDDLSPDANTPSFIEPWVHIADSAKAAVLRDHAHVEFDQQCHHCEQEALLVSRENLKTFPWLAEKLASGELTVHSWHFDIPTGVISSYNELTGAFVPL